MDFFSAPGVQIAVVLTLLVAVIIGFVREKTPIDVVAMLAMGALLVTGVLTTNETLSVFANPAPITVAAMFVLSAALERTGVIDVAGRYVVQLATRTHPIIAVAAMMLAVLVMSAFINNTPVVVILIPVVISLSKALNISASRLLIPLSFASIFGGTSTLIGTSTNILVDGVAQTHDLAPFGIFEMTPAALVLAAIGLGYLAIFGRFLLPERDSLASMLPDAKERRFFAHVLVPLESVLIGKTLKAAGFTPKRGFTVVDVLRGGASLRRQLDKLEINAGDTIIIRSKVSDMLALREAGDVAFSSEAGHAFEPMEAAETVVMEGVIGPNSRFAGRKISDLPLARMYGVYVLAVHRRGQLGDGDVADPPAGERPPSGLGRWLGAVTRSRLLRSPRRAAEAAEAAEVDSRLEVGDTVLLEGPPAAIRRVFEDQALVNLSQTTERAMRRAKAPIALAAVLSVMVLAAFEVLPIAALALIAAGAVIALGCLDHDEAYRAIRWDILMLIFGMLALGLAMQKTGAAGLIVQNVALVVGGMGAIAALSAIYFLSSVLTEFLSNNAAAILVTPIAIGLAEAMGADPRPFVVAVMFAASASFATPIGYQTNTLVYSAGGYRFTDFLRIGLPLNVLMWAAATFVIPIFWPL